MDTDHGRLLRIENKLDKIQEVLVSMARIEERQANNEGLTQIILEKLERYSGRIEKIERTVSQNSLWTGALSKLGWMIVAVLVGALAKGWL
jgi:hypothetical protein